ncbi:MAG TPA: hypothetical protein VG347_16930 [Verrucomicrobiae bacterium]|nr:hypothetical protein [Verrucomicrobiae bacterium]
MSLPMETLMQNLTGITRVKFGGKVAATIGGIGGLGLAAANRLLGRSDKKILVKDRNQ